MEYAQGGIVPQGPIPWNSAQSGCEYILAYPCDRGTGKPLGWHKFRYTEGNTVCEHCGRSPHTIQKYQVRGSTTT